MLSGWQYIPKCFVFKEIKYLWRNVEFWAFEDPNKPRWQAVGVGKALAGPLKCPTEIPGCNPPIPTNLKSTGETEEIIPNAGKVLNNESSSPCFPTGNPQTLHLERQKPWHKCGLYLERKLKPQNQPFKMISFSLNKAFDWVLGFIWL